MKDNITPLHAHTPGEERPTHNQGVVLLMKTIVEEGEERAHQKLGEDLQGYLVFTLVRFLHGKDPFEVTLALEFLRAEAMERGRQKEETLARLGDTTIILDGLFPERANKLTVSRSYFRDIGTSAFTDLAEMLRLRKALALSKNGMRGSVKSFHVSLKSFEQPAKRTIPLPVIITVAPFRGRSVRFFLWYYRKDTLSMNPRAISEFQNIVWDFYRQNGRNLPWRKTKNPYKILVSEVMLQQTQVGRVEQKYPEFIAQFPTLEALAQAPLAQVLKVWQGMGYNRRALALKRLSEAVLKDFKGKLPRDRKALESLPGVGKYTAGAVRAFAFDEPEVFIETNIRRVFIHHFFEDQEGIRDAEILPIVGEALDTKNPREWYWALMDYGSALAKEVENPNKKSKHYVKQEPFKGSHREVRGKILKFLGSEGKSSIKKLETSLKLPKEKISQVLSELANEGFITKTKTTYAIKE